jgi:hypothetical protein
MDADLKDQIRDLMVRGAQPVSLREISERRTSAPIPRASRRRRVLFTGAGVGLAAAGCAAGLVIATASPGAPTPAGAGARQASPTRQSSTFLTAAMVEHVAAASSAALGSSGHGTDTVSYSGSAYNYVVHTTKPYFPSGTIRVVNGQVYITDPTAIRLTWIHDVGGSTKPSFPEAATLLRLLSPSAKFQNAGTNVIGGIRLTHLHATQVSGLPDDATLARYANLVSAAKSGIVPDGTLTALDLWTDSHGVVHQMTIRMNGGDGQTTLTVTFSEFGQPQSIPVPPASALAGSS